MRETKTTSEFNESEKTRKLYYKVNLNTDLLKCDSNKNVSDFLDIIYSTNLHNITSTRSTNHTQTLVDNILSSVMNDDCIAGNHISTISDHHAQLLITPNYTKTQNSKKEIFSTFFLTKLQKYLTNMYLSLSLV